MLGNDTDPEGDSLAVTSKTNGSNGTVSCTSSACTYTPTGNFRGSDSFTYTIGDGRGGSDTATVSVTVTNRGPDAVDDSVSTPSGAAKQVDVLGNDTDPEGDSLAVTSKTSGSNGTVSCTSSTCTYTPTGNFRGSDSFTYTIGDGRGGSDTATVSVTVTNRGPDAVDDNGGAASAGSSKVISVLTNDTDPEGDSLTVTSKTNGAKGTVSCSNTQCTYTAATGTSGADSFTYTISDGRGGTDTATVQMINAVAVTPTQLSISIVDTTLVWPQQATINGTVTGANQTPVPNRQVALWARPSGGKAGATRARRRRTPAAS